MPAVVRASRLHWWEPSAPPAGGTAVLLVVAPWSHYDLAMLDVLDESVPGPDRPGEAPPVFVANLERYRSVEELTADIPILESFPFQSPIAALWRDGAFRNVAWGKAGRDLVADALDLPPEAFNEQVIARTPRYSPSPDRTSHVGA
ncbi:MAG: hypothetical protein BGO49_21260 [Planctomycetales bacterium 71-10]|nr:MAG: hypothetical protein BGO49_21260 [Planctomycetales bacterium 71-10]